MKMFQHMESMSPRINRNDIDWQHLQEFCVQRWKLWIIVSVCEHWHNRSWSRHHAHDDVQSTLWLSVVMEVKVFSRQSFKWKCIIFFICFRKAVCFSADVLTTTHSVVFILEPQVTVNYTTTKYIQENMNTESRSCGGRHCSCPPRHTGQKNYWR